MDAIGKYTILEVIGRGGMGTVYRARDPVIGRDVAIKVIAEHVAALPKVKDRLYQEATSAGRLSHENIMTIFDVGETDGAPYLVMELLDGRDLRSTLDSNGTLTFERKIDMAIQICRALEYAHARGVVHRDIKPENIRILSSGRVKILDFGIARVESETRTMTNTSIGTPRYMSPEQVRGKEVDQRTDIFSFGVLLYELLSGVNPFDGTHVTAVIYKILHEEPEPIKVDDEHLAGDVQRLVTRCLEKEADRRYPDFTEVIRDLRDILAKRQSGAPTLLDVSAAKAAADAAAASDATTGLEEDDHEVPRWRRLPVYEAVANSGPQPTESEADGMQRPSSRRPAWLIPAGAAVLVIVLVGGYLLLQSGANSDGELTTSTSAAAVDLQEVGLTALRNFALKLLDEVEVEKVNAEPWKDVESLAALYQEAADSERVAIEAIELGTSDSYQRAAGALLVARNTLRAIAAAGSSDAAELRQDAEAARQSMDRARRQVQGQANSNLVSDVVERAESNRRQGESQFEAGEFTAARISFSQAEAGFIDARRTLDRAAGVEQQQRRAGAARTAVDQQRQSVYAWREAPANTAAFREAERLRTEGIRLADAGRYEDALAQFRQAEDAYARIKEPAATASAESPSEADNARSAADASRRRVPEQHRTHARYEEAESLVQSAQRAYAQNDFTRSAELFEQAERIYSEVAAIPVRTSPEAAARAALEPLLNRFKSGLQDEDAAALRRLHSFLGAYSAMFDVAEDISADISYSDLNVTGSRATASVLVQMSYKNKTQRMRQENQSVRLRWTLEENADSGWQLLDVTPL